MRAAASRSVVWTAIGKGANTVVSLLVTAVLTRLLTPADFGIIAMVVVLSGFLNIVAEAGLSTAVVQKRNLEQRALSSLFWFGLGVGAVTTALMALAAPLAALFFSEPRLTPVVALMSLGFVAISLGRVPNGLLERSFKFREIALAEVVAALVGGVVGITGALLDFGYFALVLQTLTTAFLNAILRLLLSRFRPSRALDLHEVRAVSGYSGGVVAFAAINYWARNLDKALIGRFLGAASLGFYGRAYQLMLYPLEAINGILNPTLHPVLSSLQLDRPRMARTYCKLAKLVAVLALPAMGILGALAPEVVRTIWGPQWEPSIRVFSILCFVGSVQPVGATFGAVFLATNRTRSLALLGLVNAVVIMVGIAAGVPYGIEGVAIGYSVAYGLIFLPTMYIVVVRLLGGKVRDMVAVLGPAMLMAAVVLAVLLLYNGVMRERWGDLPHLLFGIAIGVATWLGTFVVVDRSLLAEAVSLARPRQRAPSSDSSVG